MKWIPKDKLYVNPYGWHRNSVRDDGVEYIKKDTLLKYINNEISEICVGGEKIALEHLFKYIKSL